MEGKNNCEICKKSFKTPAALKAHNTQFHRDDEAEQKVTPLHKKEEKKMKRIKIHHVEGELDYAFVSITGKDVEVSGSPFRIQRGEWVTVPEEVVGVLRDATTETYKYEPDPNVPGKFTKKPITFTKYPMTVEEVRAA